MNLSIDEKALIKQLGDLMEKESASIEKNLSKNISKILQKKDKNLLTAYLYKGQPRVILGDIQGSSAEEATQKEIVDCFTGGVGKVFMAIELFMSKPAEENSNLIDTIKHVVIEMILKPLLIKLDTFFYEYETACFYDKEFNIINIGQELEINNWINKALQNETF